MAFHISYSNLDYLTAQATIWSTVSLTPHSISFNLLRKWLAFSDPGFAKGNQNAAPSRADCKLYIIFWVRHEQDKYETDAIDGLAFW